MTLRRVAVYLCLATLISSLTVPPLTAGAKPARSSLRIVRSPGSATPTFVTGIRENPRSTNPVEAARGHLASAPSRYAVAPSELRTLDILGVGNTRTVRFAQTFHGLPVFGAQYLVHLRASSGGYAVESVNGHLFSKLDVATTPVVNERTARREALYRAGQTPVDRVQRHGLTVLGDDGGQLVWHFTLRNKVPQVRREAFVSARTGAQILSYDNIHTDGPVVAKGTPAAGGTVDVQAYKRDGRLEMRDQTRQMFVDHGGEITTHDSGRRGQANAKDSNIVTTDEKRFKDPASVEAHVNAGKVYEFFLALGRDSIDGAGGDIKSVVHSPAAGECNASWDGKQMSYGDCFVKNVLPFESELDVVGHELTHGVTEKTGNLIYLAQPGAMNEAYSDYFGNAIDVDYSGTSMDSPEAGYIGEDLCGEPKPKRFPCPIRDLNDGRTTDDYIFFPAETDLGGVHENSTIYGGAMWNIRESLTGPKADAYVYKALAEYTTPLDSFLDGRNSIIQAAQAAGATPDELLAIAAAFDAQKITDGWDTGAGTTDGTILVEDVATLDPYLTAPAVDGNRWVLGDAVDKGDFFKSPLHLISGTIDGTGPVVDVSGPLTKRELDGNAAVSGDRVVWTRLTFDRKKRFIQDTDIYTSTIGGEVTQVTSTAASQDQAAVDGDLIAWEEFPLSFGPARIWVMRIGEEPIKISTKSGFSTLPSVSGDWVAYQRSNRFFHIEMVNVATDETASIKLPDTSFIVSMTTSDNFVYWTEASTGARLDIYRSPLGSNERQLVLSREDPLSPKNRFFGDTDLSANDDNLVYVTEPPRAEGTKRYTQTRDVMIIATDGTGTPQSVTTNRGDQSHPVIGDGRRVLWLDSSQGRINLLTKLVAL